MAITMGGITTALAGYSVQSANAVGAGKGPISKLTTDLISCILLPISILMVAYALFTFYWRSRCMERKQVGALTVCMTQAPRASASFADKDQLHPAALTTFCLVSAGYVFGCASGC